MNIKKWSWVKGGIWMVISVISSNVFAQSNTYLKFATSSGTPYNTNSGTSTYLYPSGLGMTGTTTISSIVPIAERPYGNSLNTFLPTSVAQSSIGYWNTLGGAPYEAKIEDLYDNDFTTGAQTLNASENNTITIDLGQSTKVGTIQIAAITAANLNGALIQYSTDNVNWTSVVQSSNGLPLTGVSGATNTSLLTVNFIAVTARYFRFVKMNDRVDLSEFRVLPIVSQSSGTVVGTNINLSDNAIAAAATTLGTLADEFVMLDLGASRTFSYVKLATAVAANLDGANVQVSNDASTWTTLTVTNAATGLSGTTLSGSSTVYPITFTFSSQTARYIRVRKAAAIVNVSEFTVGSEVAASSATTLALSGTRTTLNDGSFTTGVTTTATAGINQWLVVNLGAPRTFSHILLSALTAVANLDGSSIQTSSDGATWTTQIASITGSSTTTLVPYFFANAVTAQYVRILKGTAGSTLAISECIISPAITLSTGAKPATTNYGNLYENTIAAATTTLSGTNQYVMLDMGSAKTFSSVQIAAATSVANLDGASLQISNDAINWTSLTFTNLATNTTATTFSGSSMVYPISYTFASQTARYVRVFRAATGVISLSEFRVSPGVYQSSATSLANNAIPSTLSDNNMTTGALSNTGTTPFVALNFDAPKSFSTVELAPHTAIANLNGATLQTSNDGVTWTSISSVLDITSNTPSSTVTNAVLNTKRIYSFAAQTAQYLRLVKLDGTAIGVSEFKVGTTISQSSGTSIGTVANLSDNSVAAAAITATGLNQWVMRDLGEVKSVNFVELATSGSVINLDGAVLQASTDGVNWTTLNIKNNRTGVSGTAISGSSLSYPDIFSFATTSARYLRVFRAASGVVAVSEFQVSTAVYQSSGTTYASSTNLYDGINSTSAATTSAGTASAPAFVGLNLGIAQTISSVEISTTNTAQLNTATLEYSTDFMTWTPLIASISGITANQSNILTFSPVSARYIRVRSNSVILNISEFKVLKDSISTTKILNPAITSGVSAVLPIGFNFNFKGAIYSNFSVSSEGLLRLGTVSVTTESLNNTISIANNPVLFAQWDDLATGDAASNGGVTKTLIGTAPNRKLVLEWRARNATTTGTTNLNYQIVLHETSNKIEYIYIDGTNNTTDASIGIATGTVADITRKFYSVSPNASISSTTYSNMKPNDFVRQWPGNGTIYSFTPTELPVTATVPTDFVSLDNAMGAVNWVGAPNNGGYTVTINGNYTETAPNAYATTPTGTSWVKLAGFLLTANGTSTKPIVFKWSGTGSKPIFRNGKGIGNMDYIIGLSGSDYVTLDGLSLVDTTNHTSAFTAAQHTAANNLHAEMGIALFKEKYNTTTGNNGCNTVQIKNCEIDLSRWPNQVVNYTYSYSDGFTTYSYYGTSKKFWSRGIYATRYTHLGAGQVPSKYPMYSYNFNAGIKTQNDVHQNCTLSSNLINDCTFGVEWDDAWLKSGTNFYAGTNNKIGISGGGNTITNWGPQPAASNATAYLYNSSTYGQGSFVAGICMGGQKDFTVEYNSISSAVDESGTTTTPATNISFIQNFAGILIGRSGMNQDFPRHATGFFKKINFNTISDINVTTTTASNTKSSYGIVDVEGYSPDISNASTTNVSTGSVDIRNNTISNLISRSGNVRGISTRMPLYSTTGFYYNLGSNNYEYDYFNTNGNVTIKNNTIQKLAQLGNNSYNTSSLGSVVGILYGAAAKNLYIENNILGGTGNNGFVVGSTNNTTPSTNNFINTHQIGLKGILVDRSNTYITPLLVSIKNNTISNLDRLAGTITTYTNQRAAAASAITINNGATTNNVDSNVISGMDIANGLYNATTNNDFSVIYVVGRPKSGSAIVNIRSNSISGITRNQFGFLTSMATGSGDNAVTIGIRAENTANNQIRTIQNNTIDGISQTATYTTTAAQQNLFYSRLIGIKTYGRNVTNDATAISGNTITNFSGDHWGYAGTLNSTSFTSAFSTIGVLARDGQYININGNRICGLSTNLSGTTATSYASYEVGVVGITFGKSGTGAAATRSTLGESVYNNFVSELTAPNISEENAIEGIVYWGYGRFARIAHNTIALGNPTGGATGRLTTTGNTFGVHGLSLCNYYVNTAAYPTIVRNNIISINAAAKGSSGATAYASTTTGGFNACWRTSQTTVKKKPQGIDNSTGGNVYFINDSVRNYIYAQGISTTQAIYNFSGLRNAFGYYKNNPPISYQNTTYNLVNDTVSAGKYFNSSCGKYKSFWGSPEKGSFIDVDGSNNLLTMPFVNSGSTCSDKLKILSTANSFVVSAAKFFGAPLNITTDYFGTTRSTSSPTVGAHVAPAGSSGSSAPVIDFDYEPICDGVCTGSKSMTVTITPPNGKSIPTNLSDPEIPRIYYRRIYNNSAYASATTTAAATTAIVDNNWFYRDGLNNKSGPSGWRFVKPKSVSGNDYVFDLQDSLLSGTVAANQVVPTYSIEYFVIARTTDGTVVNWSSGDLSFSCPTSVIMNNTTTGTTAVIGPYDGDALPSAYNTTTPSASALNHGTADIVENSVADKYTIYKGSDLTRTIVVNNTGLSYTTSSTTNPTTASVTIPICVGENVNLNARTFITATTDQFNDGCISYKFQVANDAAFTSGVQNFSQADTNFNYQITTAGTKFFRYWLDCAGTNASNTNSNIIAFTATDCPTNTSPDVTNSTICLTTSKTISVTTSTATVSKFFWVVNPFGKPYTNPPTATTATSQNITFTPTSVNESGTWKSYVTNATGNSLLDQVVKSADYYNASIPGYLTSGGDALKGKGTAFSTSKFIKLNAISLIGATGDGTASSGYKINLYGKSGDLIYTASGASVADNTATATALTNWYIPPGDYVLALDEAVSGTSITGSFANLSINGPLNYPNTATPAITVQGGVETITDFDNADNSVDNYFVDWDYTEYCTSPSDTFQLTLNPSSCCLVPVLPTMTITTDSAVNTCGIIKYTVTFTNSTGAAISNMKFSTDLNAGQYLVDSSILTTTTTFGAKATIVPSVYADEPNFVLDTMTIPIGTSSFSFQVDVRNKVEIPSNIFTLQNDCPLNIRKVVYPAQSCISCVGGLGSINTADVWDLGGSSAKTTNSLPNFVIGTPNSGQMKANIALVYANSASEYQPNSYPRKFGNYVQFGRLDNKTGASGLATYKVSLKDSANSSLAARPSFKIAGLSSASGQSDRIKVYGICGTDTIPAVLKYTSDSAKSTFTISQNQAIARSFNLSTPNDMNTVSVNFDKPVVDLIVEWTEDRVPVISSYKSIYIGEMTFTCNNPIEASNDNVYIESAILEDSLYTCNQATIRLKVNNYNCEAQVINLHNTLPSGLQYVDTSYVALGEEEASYGADTFSAKNVNIPAGTSYLYIKVKPTNTLNSGIYFINFQYDVVGGNNDPSPYYTDDNNGIDGFQDSKLVYFASTPIDMPSATLEVSGCMDTAYSGSIVTYKVTLVNNSSSILSDLNLENLFDSDQKLVANSLVINGLNTGWVANNYATDNFVNLSNVSIPANSTATIEYKSNTQNVKNSFENVVSVFKNPSDNCAIGTIFSTNKVVVPICKINCILVNPRITYRMRKQ